MFVKYVMTLILFFLGPCFPNIFTEVPLNHDVNVFLEACQKMYPKVPIKVLEEYISDTLKYSPHRESRVSNIPACFLFIFWCNTLQCVINLSIVIPLYL